MRTWAADKVLCQVLQKWGQVGQVRLEAEEPRNPRAGHPGFRTQLYKPEHLILRWVKVLSEKIPQVTASENL